MRYDQPARIRGAAKISALSLDPTAPVLALVCGSRVGGLVSTQMTFRFAHLPLACSLVACAPSATTAVVPPRDAPLVLADAGASPLAEPKIDCEGTIRLEAPPADAVCDDASRFWPGSCSVQLRFVMTNCLEAPVSPEELTATADGDRQIVWNFEPHTIPPGGQWVFERSPGQVPPGEYRLSLTYRVGGIAGEPVAGLLVVTNSALTRAEQACKACNGDFGPHGMLGQVGCLCRMDDAGKPCDDGNDCQGKCVGRDEAFVCSEFATVFGCHSYLPKGWSEQRHTPPVRVPRICVD